MFTIREHLAAACCMPAVDRPASHSVHSSHSVRQAAGSVKGLPSGPTAKRGRPPNPAPLPPPIDHRLPLTIAQTKLSLSESRAFLAARKSGFLLVSDIPPESRPRMSFKSRPRTPQQKMARKLKSHESRAVLRANHLIKPPSSFLIFRAEFQRKRLHDVESTHSNNSTQSHLKVPTAAEVGVQASKEWMNMPLEERGKYKQIADDLWRVYKSRDRDSYPNDMANSRA
ncbi:hypothetical protein HDU84_001731 [Entophlyctis sp. JEL0112]|nr:hypothetical protein HDU84_001731 [Entophlyctis sp. JEL0112]